VTSMVPMRFLHWFLSALDRGTSAPATLLYGPPAYGVERSGLWERLLFFALVALLMAWGVLAAW
jgi:hypothetical protein